MHVCTEITVLLLFFCFPRVLLHYTEEEGLIVSLQYSTVRYGRDRSHMPQQQLIARTMFGMFGSLSTSTLKTIFESAGSVAPHASLHLYGPTDGLRFQCMDMHVPHRRCMRRPTRSQWNTTETGVIGVSLTDICRVLKSFATEATNDPLVHLRTVAGDSRQSCTSFIRTEDKHLR